MSAQQDLADHIAEWAGRPLKFGESDCAQFIAAWVLRRTGKDVALRYGSKAEAQELLAAGGGLAKVLARQAARHGLKGRDYAEHGDVALIEFDGLACCAIRASTDWVLYRDGRLSIVPALSGRVLAAWRVECP